jgi:hypothetical protein
MSSTEDDLQTLARDEMHELIREVRRCGGSVMTSMAKLTTS